MQPVAVTAPAPRPPQRPAAPRGRWIWRVSGIVTVAALTAAAAAIIAHQKGPVQYADPMSTATKSLTIPQPVTSVRVLTLGMPVQVTAGPGNRVRVTELIQYDLKAAWQGATQAAAQPDPGAASPSAGSPDPAGLLAVPPTVSGHLLTLDGTACDQAACAVAFALTVPRGTRLSVSTAGGDVILSGTADATVDSGGGNVYAAGLRGPLSVITGSGNLMVNGLAGSLYADTSGGSVNGSGLAAPTATVITGGGNAWLGFADAPGTLMTSTGGGGALLAVPPGPYALTADSGGADQVITVATDPAAQRSITVTSSGGPLHVEPPAAGSLPPIPPFPSFSSELPGGKGGFYQAAPPDVPAPPLPPGQ